MASTGTTDVLIVGAGPVGLTLAIDLAQRGVDVTVVETRPFEELPSVKCNHVSARSMEIFRRLGVSSQVRAAGLPDSFRNDVLYTTTVLGYELSRIRIPDRKTRYSSTDGPDTWWPTPEPPHRINQIYLEPVLRQYASTISGLKVRYRTEAEGFSQTDDAVTTYIRDLDNGRQSQIESRFLVGCDGATSRVRSGIGAKYVGDAVVQRVQSTYIRAPRLLEMMRHEPAWMTLSLNARRCGNMVAIDGKERWIVHNYLFEHETDFDSIDRDQVIREILGVGADFEYEALNKEDWIGRRLVADKFRDRRAFICGDAAHIWVPYGGYGMNAGIADAENLSWKLAAHINGWAPETLLNTYEAERLPITSQVSRFAMSHAIKAIRQRSSIPPEIETPGPEGERVRDAIGKEAYDLNVQQYCCGGLNFGYFYEGSPIIAYDGEDAPVYSMAEFTPSSVPGCRTPHVWLDQCTSLYDRTGRDYSILRFDPGLDVKPFLDAASDRGVPFKLVDVPPAGSDPAYRHKLVISRPDQHVAWRGNEVPAQPGPVIDRLRAAIAGRSRT